MFYAAENGYGTDTSIGFSNTWYVVAFATAEARDAWVESRRTVSARAITSREVPRWHGVTVDGRKGEYLALDNYSIAEIPGAVGVIVRGTRWDALPRLHG